MSTSNYHHGNLRTALIQAGLTILQEDGIEALSLRGVAREAGVSATAPYRHFPDKQALLAAIAATGFARLDAALQAANAITPGIVALRAQGVAYVVFAVNEPALFRLMFSPLTSGQPDEAVAAYATLRTRVATLATPERIDTVTLAAWSMVHGLATLLVEGKIAAPDPAALAAAVTAVFDVTAG